METINNMKYASSRKIVRTLIFTASMLFMALCSKAQLNPFQTMFYQNRYLLNPAMAGTEKGLDLNFGYRQQWTSFPGTPKTTSLTADYQATDKVGVGLNFSDDESGLIRSTRVMGSYAYHLPLSDKNEHLSFGLSLGVNDARVDYSRIVGDVSDEEIAVYNQLKPYIDGDFGAAYTSGNLFVSATMPNLKSTLFKASDSRFDADLLIFEGAVGYKFNLDNEYASNTLEPIAAYRMVRGFKDIYDAGVNFSMNNYGIYVQTIYHTNQSMSIGFGLNQKTYEVNFAYNVETGALSNYTNGAFEIGLKLNLFNKTGAR